MANSKLPHERLREWADRGEKSNICPSFYMCHDMAPDDECSYIVIERDAFRNLADEIERYYFPRPRFEDGEPLSRGDEFVEESGDVLRAVWFGFVPRGEYDSTIRIVCHDNSSYDLCVAKQLKRPAPKVLDADGVPIETRTWMYDLCTGDRVKVLALLPSGNVSVESYDDAVSDYVYSVNPSRLSLSEPDSLERLRNEMLVATKVNQTVESAKHDIEVFADRLTALMERGEE